MNTATSNRGTRLASTSTIFFFLPSIAQEVDRISINATRQTFLEQYMSDLTQQQRFLPQTRGPKPTHMPLRRNTIITCLLLSIMPLLTGCGGGDETGSNPSDMMTSGSAGAAASLEWNPVPDSSVSAYFVYYGKQSSGEPGICSYESSVSVESPAATVTNLDPDTRYYFAVSAYNGLESACSEEVSTVTPSASA